MDHTKESPTVLSLCTGYGGIEKGLEKAIGKITPVAHVEIEAFADTNLVNKMETNRMVPVPIWTNLKTFRPYIFRDKVDILTGGYPCQPFSSAGKRKGEDDPRHLWPQFRKTIKAVRPGLCFFENVSGHTSLGLRQVLTDLVKLGYSVENDCGEPTFGLFTAAEVGAPHKRERVFILAHRISVWESQSERYFEKLREWIIHRSEKLGNTQGDNKRWMPFPTMHRKGFEVGGSGCELAHPEKQGLQERWDQKTVSGKNQIKISGFTGSCHQWPARPGQLQYEWEEPRTLANTQDTKRGTRKKTIEGCKGIRQNRSTNQSAGILAHPELSGAPSNRSNVRMGRIEEQQASGPRRTQTKTQSKLGRSIDGNRDRVDRLRLCGNAVVPDQAAKAFLVLGKRIWAPDAKKVQPSIQLEMFA